MTTEEAKRLVDEVFRESPVIAEWRELAKRERVERAKLLRMAVWATAQHASYNGSDPKRWDRLKDGEDRAWQAYCDSL